MEQPSKPPAEEPLGLLDRILGAEVRLGFRNGAVFGGFDRFVEKFVPEAAARHPHLAGDLERIQRVLGDYRRAGARERRDRVEACAGIVARLAGRGAHAPSGESPGSAPAERVPSRTERRGTPETAERARPDEPLTLATPVERLPGVGPRRAELLSLLGLRTAGDMLLHRPIRYLDRSRPLAIGDLAADEVQTFRATVGKILPSGHRFLRSTRARLEDGGQTIEAVWFHQPYIARQLVVGTRYLFHGKVKPAARGGLEVVNPDFEPDIEEGERRELVPVYSTTEGLPQKTIRRLIDQVLPLTQTAPDPLPSTIREAHAWMSRGEAVRALHHPRDAGEPERARQRLAYEELLLLQLTLELHRHGREEGPAGHPIVVPAGLADRVGRCLDLDLTGAQRRSIDEIVQDLESPRPMARLLQGDVGSGKTLVAVASLLAAAEAGYQGAFMAPTEILAEQHYFGLRDLATRLGLRTQLLTGSTPKKERLRTVEELAAGEIQVLVGTQALLSEDVQFRQLGLVIIDEQHRFGVLQRDQLLAKGTAPNLLVMTATPIPRTLTLALYGDLDQSLLDEMPRGRGEITTSWISPERISKAHQDVHQALEQGQQAYVVCPLVEESDGVARSDAVNIHSELAAGPFAGVPVGLLHGQMDWRTKQAVMEDFRHGRIRILVSTSVIEVGIDVPNATRMIVLDAGAFGLAQLHQLRGRIGRGPAPSWCWLVHGRGSPEARTRLKALVESRDGFVIADADLAMRGPGELFGVRQAGLPDLTMADLGRDLDLMRMAHQDARGLRARDPGLAAPEHHELKHLVSIRADRYRRH